MEENSGRTRQGHRDAEGPTTGKPSRGQHGPECRPKVVKGGANWNGNGSKRRHEAQGVGTSGRGWQAAVADDIQVGGALHRERRWGAGEN